MRTPRILPVAAALIACTPPDDAPVDSDTDPGVDPTLFPVRAELLGGGGPSVTFSDDALGTHCAHLPGNLDRSVSEITDVDHKNMVAPYRGLMVVPWAPEYGRGGLSFFDVSDPCAPTKVGEGYSEYMRETHNITFVHLPEGDPHAGDWAAVNMGGIKASVDMGGQGLEFWDVSDPTAPVPVSQLVLEELFYPDAYEGINLSLSWAYPYVYVASAIHGVHLVDATDPAAPERIALIDVPDMRVGGVFALGDVLWLTGSEQRTHALYDISDPLDPQPILGGRFESVDGEGTAVEAYHSNVSGHLGLFARKEGGGGPIVYDLSDPSSPTFLADMRYDGMSGGYVFWDEGFAFTGDSNGSHITDLRDLSNPVEVLAYRFGDEGAADLDTLTPYGNVAIAAVDDPGGYSELERGEGSRVVPWRAQPDDTPPGLMASWPEDGDADVATGQALYLGFDDFIEPSTAVDGIGVRLRVGGEDGEIVPCWANAEEGRVHVRPKAPLQPGTAYVLQLLPDGLEDLNGNRLTEPQSIGFTTAE